MVWGTGKGNRGDPTLRHLTSSTFLRGKLLESIPDKPDSTEFHKVTRMPAHLEDVATLTRQSRRKFCD